MDEIINYTTQTPENTNPNVLKDMLKNYKEEAKLQEISNIVNDISERSENLFDESFALAKATGVTKTGDNEYTGTASAFDGFMLTPKTLSENVYYSISFDIYTEANDSTSGNGLQLAFGNDDSLLGVKYFENSLTSSYHYHTYGKEESIDSEDDAELRTDIYWQLEAIDNPGNIWHISNIQVVVGEDEPEEFITQYTAVDLKARAEIDEINDRLQSIEARLTALES